MTAPERSRVLYLVDGTAQLFRAFYAVPGLTNPAGDPTGAVFGFTNMLRKLILDEGADRMAVTWDLAGPTFRHERYPAYKANRPEMPEELGRQFPWAKRVCAALGVPCLERDGYEADDLIGTLTARAREAGLEVVIVASDKDLLQLVDDGVVNLNPSKDLRLDAGGVRDVFGVAPDRVRDVLGLMGDAVDNIPGVPGVGEKTAKEIVSRYGGMDDILARAERFVAAYDARDAALAAMATAEADPEVLDSALEAIAAVRSALDALTAAEPPGPMRDRFESTASELVDDGAPDPDPKAIRKRFRPVRKVMKALDPKSAKRQWYAIHENREQAILSRELATIALDAPLEVEAIDLVIADPDRPLATELFRELGFRSLTAEFEGEAPDPATTPDGPEEPVGTTDYRTVLDGGALAEVVQGCRAAGRFAVDTETDGTDPMRANLVGVSLSSAAGTGAYVPVGHRYLGMPDQLSADSVRDALAPLLADPALRRIGQNVKYDDHVLRRHGMPVESWALDTMVAAFDLDPGRPTYKMDALAAEYLGHTTTPYEAIAGKGSSQRTLDVVDVETVTNYAAEDADVTLRLADALEPRLEAAGVASVYRDLDGPVLPILARMEARGIRVDPDLLAAMSKRMDAGIAEARAAVFEMAGIEFNIDSPKQMREVLFEQLGLTPRRKTAKSKAYSTDAQTLEELTAEHPIASRILEYRELAKLKSTYVDALPQLILPETGRIHTSYHVTGAATGRLSSSDPNLQNIPARTEVGLAIRAAFVPQDGWIFLASDYSQVELRVLAHLCEDPELVAAFRAGEDIHRHTAALVAGIDPTEVTPDLRRRAKAVNFGILYGMSEHRLAREQGMAFSEARAFIEAYFDRFARVREYIDGVREQVRQDAEVRTLFGRIRLFPQLHRKIGRPQQEQALRAAVNTTIQGTAADLMKMAMIAVDAELERGGYRAHMLLQVHDELLLEVHPDDGPAVAACVRQAMEGVYPLAVPLLVDQKEGPDWRAVT